MHVIYKLQRWLLSAAHAFCLTSTRLLTTNRQMQSANDIYSNYPSVIYAIEEIRCHCAKKPVTTMLTYPWKCTVLHCNHLGNTWKPLVLMTQHFDYHPRLRSGNNQSVRSSAPVVSRCFPGGYNVKLYISRGRVAWWLLAFLCCVYAKERNKDF